MLLRINPTGSKHTEFLHRIAGTCSTEHLATKIFTSRQLLYQKYKDFLFSSRQPGKVQIAVLWKLWRIAGGQEHPGTPTVAGAVSCAKLFCEKRNF